MSFPPVSHLPLLDIQNVTNQQNPEALFYNFNFTQEATVYGIPILPTLGVKGEF